MNDFTPDDVKKQMTTKGKKPRGAPSRLDDTLWEMEAQTITPLKGRAKKPQKKTAETKSEAPRPAKGAPVQGSVAQTPAPYIPPALKGAQPAQNKGGGVDARLKEKIRRGKMPIEARIDLHGLNHFQAEDNLRGFIIRCAENGVRLVLVITGKGGQSADPLKRGDGVLRQSVPQWLKEPPLSALVLYTCESKPKDGGAGALYVYLKRKRPS